MQCMHAVYKAAAAVVRAQCGCHPRRRAGQACRMQLYLLCDPCSRKLHGRAASGLTSVAGLLTSRVQAMCRKFDGPMRARIICAAMQDAVWAGGVVVESDLRRPARWICAPLLNSLRKHARWVC